TRQQPTKNGNFASRGLLRDRKSFEIFAVIARRFKGLGQHTRPSSRVAVELAVRATLRAVANIMPRGRLRLATSPSCTGSAPTPNTIGMLVVAALAARVGTSPAVTITATRRADWNSAPVGHMLAVPRG